jgi:hypothetical protein
MVDYNETIDAAVSEAKDAYSEADVSPFDHGFAHMNLDGRTKLAKEMNNHPSIDASDSSYVTIDGVTRYLTLQKAAYRAFVNELRDRGIDTEVRISGRLD